MTVTSDGMSPDISSDTASHVLVVGGGHASIPVIERARAWTRLGWQVTLLSESSSLLYSGMVPEMLGGVYTPDEVRIDLEWLCEGADVRFVKGHAVRLDPATRTVTDAAGAMHTADLVALDVGVRTAGLENAEGVVPTKPFTRMEALARRIDEGEVRRVGIVGGGAAGVETALNLSGRGLAVWIVEPGERILDAFPEGLARRAERLLRERGGRIHRAEAVSADAISVTLSDDRRLAADAILWAAGPASQPWLAESGLFVNDEGYVRTHATLQALSYPWLFAAGDCATIEGLALRKIGVHAVKQGPLLAENLERSMRALTEGTTAELKPFTPYRVAPLILSTGEREGWWAAGPLWLRSTSMLRLKHTIDLQWIRRYQAEGLHHHLAHADHAGG